MNWENVNDPAVERAVRTVREMENGELVEALRQLSCDLVAGRDYFAAEACAEAAARIERKRK